MITAILYNLLDQISLYTAVTVVTLLKLVGFFN